MSINLVEIIQAPTAACDAPEAHNLLRMRISAKVDYALRACTELAVAGDGPTKGDRIAAAQAIPIKFLENILSELRNAGIVATQRGVEGGYWLARPAEQITLAEVMRALEGPLANVRGHRPETLVYEARPRRSWSSGSPCAQASAPCSRPRPWPTSRRASYPLR